MKSALILIVVVIIIGGACNVSHQYDVYVRNETGEDLKISFKSMKHKDGPIEGAINLKSRERKLIISTVDLNSGRGYIGTTAQHCYLVADYVDAFTSDDTQASLRWCTEDVDFVVEDEGQGVFTMIFKNEHF